MQEQQAAVQYGNVPIDLTRKMDSAFFSIGTLADVIKNEVVELNLCP